MADSHLGPLFPEFGKVAGFAGKMPAARNGVRALP